MQSQYLADLKREIKKYCGFMNPEPVRGYANEAFQILSEPNTSLPIDDSTNPLIQVFMSILDNKKTNKTAAPLIVTICDCIRIKIIAGNALRAITRRLENFECTDRDTALKIIQFATRTLPKHFLHIDIFQSIVSIILSFCSDTDELVSETSSAAADQIICSFLDFSETQALTAEHVRDINSCFSMSRDNSAQFDNHRHKIPYLVIRDVSRICCGQDPLWFRVKTLPKAVSYGILTKVISHHSELLNSSKHFQELILSAATCAYQYKAPLSFCVKCTDTFMEMLPKASSVIFRDFLNDLDKTSPNFRNSLLFFRILLLKNDTMFVRFCLRCDQNANILTSLISKLRKSCESAPKDDRIELCLLPKQFDYKIQNPVSSCVEIALYFVQSCYKAQNSALKILVINSDKSVVLSIADGEAESQVAKLIAFKRACAPITRSARQIKYEWVPLKMSSFLGCVLAAVQDPIPETQSITLNMAHACFNPQSHPIMITQTFPVQLERLFEHMPEVEIFEDSLKYLVHQRLCHQFIAVWLNTIKDEAKAARAVRLLLNSKLYNKDFWAAIISECVMKEAIKQILKSKDPMLSSALAILASKQPIELSKVMNEPEMYEAMFGRLKFSVDQVLDYFTYLCENDTFGNVEFLKYLFFCLASRWEEMKEQYEKICQIKDSAKSPASQIVGVSICNCCQIIGIMDKFKERISKIETSVSLFFKVAMNREERSPELVKEVYESFNRYGRLRNFKESLILCGESQSPDMFVISVLELATCHTSGRRTCISNMIAASKDADMQSLRERYDLLSEHTKWDLSMFILKCTFGLLKKYPFHGILCDLFNSLCKINGLSEEENARFHLPLAFLSNEFLDFGVFSSIRGDAVDYICGALMSEFTCQHLAECIDLLIDAAHNGALGHVKERLAEWLLKTMSKSTNDVISVKASLLFSMLDVCETKEGETGNFMEQTPFNIEETEAREMIKTIALNYKE